MLEIDLQMRQSSTKRRSLDVIPVGRSLMNVRKSNGPRTVPWGTPEGTGTNPMTSRLLPHAGIGMSSITAHICTGKNMHGENMHGEKLN